MSDSLREQLLKAGLVTKKQAAKSERQPFRGGKRREAPPAAGSGAASASKAARDRELNREQQEKVEARARRAGLRQIIDQHRVPSPESDEYFNFVDGGKVRRIAVDGGLRARLVAGTLVIARCDGRYAMIPAEVATLVRERDPAAVVTPGSSAAPGCGEDEPYREFAVPDDLNW